MQHTKIVLFLSVISLLYACHPQGETQDSKTKQLYENSIRRNPAVEAAKTVVHIDTGCTAFFVENSQGKTILGSARHCFDFNEEAWCSKPGVMIDNDGHTGTCKRIIASDPSRDIMFFEADYDQPVPVNRTFRLADYHPTVGTRLNMLGYPADPMRKEALTLTENCWVLSDISPSPYNDGMTSDPSQNHNCSTYGGNSGGPMFIEGTRDVIGLPFTYQPNLFTLLPSSLNSSSAYLASMADFISFKRETLEAEGIVISQAQPELPVVSQALVLNSDEQGFADLCASSESLSPESKQTLQALKQAVFTEDCALAAFRLYRISELNLAHQNLTDLSLFRLPVFQNGQILALYFMGNPLIAAEELSLLSNLRYLNLAETGVQSLPGLSNLKSLSLLDLSNNGIQDLNKALDSAALPKLNDLKLNGNAISDVKALANFPALKRLSLDGNKGDPSQLTASLGQLPQALERLSLRSAGLKSLAGLQTSRVFNQLDIAANELDSIAELSELPYKNYFQALVLSGNRISDVQPLAGFSRLTQLYAYNNLITDLKPLTGLQNLQFLGLYGNPVQDLSPLNELKALDSLILGQNPNLESGSCPLFNASICFWY